MLDKYDIIFIRKLKLSFSLIELSIFVLISGVLAASAIISMDIITQSKAQAVISQFETYREAINRFYHDYEKAHLYLFKTIPNLVSYEYKSIVNKYYEDKKNPLYPINHEHMLLKKFLSAHQGFDRRQIQDWLNLFSFIMNPPFNRFEKAIELIKLMINTRNVVRFKENKSKKIKKTPSLS